MEGTSIRSTAFEEVLSAEGHVLFIGYCKVVYMNEGSFKKC